MNRRRLLRVVVATAFLAPVAPAATATGPTGGPCAPLGFVRQGTALIALTAPGAALQPPHVPDTTVAVADGVPQLGLHELSVTGDLDATMRALTATPGVRWAGRDRVVTANRVPHDPLFRRQWALARVHAAQAWNIDIGVAHPTTIAVLDTGVDGTHPDLEGRVLQGVDLVDGDTDASDEQFHGTAVASIAAADTDNRIGMAGVSWGARVLPVRVLDSTGAGSECTVAAGLVYAGDRAPILNLSLGATADCTPLMQNAVQYAADRGALVVAAVGNSGRHGNPPEEPADCAGVVGVAATDQHDRHAPFSERGPQVLLSAPGVQVISAVREPNGDHAWALLDGTSMATPMVSGIASLVLAHHPGWTAGQVLNRLERTAHDLGPRGRDGIFGYGRVDAVRAVR